MAESRRGIESELKRRKQDALDRLLALDPTPVPDRYVDWKHEYAQRAGSENREKPGTDNSR